MKYVHLIWAGLSRRKARTVLTLLSIIAAFLLFGLLDTVRSSFENAGQTAYGHDRLLIIPRMSYSMRPLPFSLLDQIKQVPGVVQTDYASHVAGTYQNPNNFLVVEAHPDSFYDLYPEFGISSQVRAAMRQTRAGVLAGEALAQKYHFKVGDKISLESKTMRRDGSTVWTFDIVGIFRWMDPNKKASEKHFFGNWDYLNESRQSGSNTVAHFAVKVSDVLQVDRVAQQIDTMTANSDHETKTQSENSFFLATYRQFGDMGVIIRSIMGAVFFTLLLLAGHTVAQAVQERIPEFAVLKTIGFTGRSVLALVLVESLVLIVLGGVIGLTVATSAVALSTSLAQELLPMPILPIGKDVWLRGLILAAAIALLVGTLPAMRGLRLRPVDALSGR